MSLRSFHVAAVGVSLLLLVGTVLGQDVGSWSFDEGSGLTVTDSSGMGNHGAISTESMWSVPGYDGTGSCLDFDGYSGDTYVSFPDSPSLDFNGEILLSAWVNREDSGNTLDPLFTKSEGSSVAYGLDLHNGYLFFLGNYQNSGTYFQVESDVAVPLGEWTHVSVSYDMEFVRFYINGDAAGIQPLSTPIVNNDGPLYLGIDSPGFTERYQGRMDDVVVSNVPEPATMSLLVMGAIALVRKRRS